MCASENSSGELVLSFHCAGSLGVKTWSGLAAGALTHWAISPATLALVRRFGRVFAYCAKYLSLVPSIKTGFSGISQ